MIILLIIAVWIPVLSLVAGACVAARAGDLEHLAPAGGERQKRPLHAQPGGSAGRMVFTKSSRLQTPVPRP